MNQQSLYKPVTRAIFALLPLPWFRLFLYVLRHDDDYLSPGFNFTAFLQTHLKFNAIKLLQQKPSNYYRF
jgi:hypothetical protein